MSKEITSDADEMESIDDGVQPYFATFAMVREGDNVVQDKLICLNTFRMRGYYFVEVGENVISDVGMRFNAMSGEFDFVAPENESSSTGDTLSS